VETYSGYDVAVARYNTNGSLDTSFGTNGVFLSNLSSGVDVGSSIALQADNKLVISGRASADWFVMRLTVAGALDSSFAGDGTYVSSISSEDDVAYSVKVQQNGKLVISGATEASSNNNDVFITRLLANGTPDPTFNGGNVKITDYGPNIETYSSEIQNDGKIVLAGFAFNAVSNNDAALLRYLGDPPPPGNGQLRGVIYELHPVGVRYSDNVLVSDSQGPSIVTGGGGRYELSLPPGVRTVTYSKAGYYTQQQFPAIFSNSITTRDLVMTRIDCWPTGDACINEFVNVVPVFGILSDMSGTLNAVCEAGQEIRAGNHYRAGILAIINLVDLLSEVFVGHSEVYDLVEAFTLCVEAKLYDWIGEHLGPEAQKEYSRDLFRLIMLAFPPSAPLIVMLEIAPPSGSTTAQSFNLATQSAPELHIYSGSQHLGLNNGQMEHSIPYSYLFRVDGKYQIAIIKNAYSAYSLRILGQGDLPYYLTIINPRSDRSGVMLSYDDLVASNSSITTINLGQNVINFNLQVDRDGNGTIDQTVPPIGTETLLPDMVYLPVMMKNQTGQTPPTNNPPRVPSNPFPPQDAQNQGSSLQLSWIGGSPDGRSVSYDVYMEKDDLSPDVLICSHVSTTTCNVSALIGSSNYFWRVIARDSLGMTTAGPLWYFSTQTPANLPPNIPQVISPPNGSTNQALNVNLSWSGGDPDGDGVIYDVYFEANDSTPDVLVSNNQVANTYDPGLLSPSTQYYWEVVAEDEHGLTTHGPVWSFATSAPSWQEVGVGSASDGGISQTGKAASAPVISVAPDGTPYVAWLDGSNDMYYLYAKRWNGTNWVQVGSGPISDVNICSATYINKISLAVSSAGTPYIAWCDDRSGDSEIYVRYWNGSVWSEVGDGSATGGGISNNSGNSESPSLAVSSDGYVYVAWADDTSGDWEVYVKIWVNFTWVEWMGSASSGGISNNNGSSVGPWINIAAVSQPFVSWLDDSSGNLEVYVRQLSGSTWGELGTGSASGGGVSNTSDTTFYTSNALSASGVPYVSWVDYNPMTLTYKIYVKYWNGSSWVNTVAGPIIYWTESNPLMGFPSIAIAPDGRPYIAWYAGHSGDTEVYVLKWDGSSWVEVGSGSASGGGISNNTGSSYLPMIAIAPGGTPYVAWWDNTSGAGETYAKLWR
jgi:uncharacterized delta-60 repeat protein